MRKYKKKIKKQKWKFNRALIFADLMGRGKATVAMTDKVKLVSSDIIGDADNTSLP